MSENLYERPAMSLEEAAMQPAMEAELETAGMQDVDALGMTPALEREQPITKLTSQMREKMRQSEQAADRMRGAQVVWMSSEIPVHNEPVQQRRNAPNPQRQTSPRIGTQVRTREAGNDSAPMQGVLQGTVRRMVKQEQTMKKQPMTAHQAVAAPLKQTVLMPQAAIALPATMQVEGTVE